MRLTTRYLQHTITAHDEDVLIDLDFDSAAQDTEHRVHRSCIVSPFHLVLFEFEETPAHEGFLARRIIVAHITRGQFCGLE